MYILSINLYRYYLIVGVKNWEDNSNYQVSAVTAMRSCCCSCWPYKSQPMREIHAAILTSLFYLLAVCVALSTHRPHKQCTLLLLGLSLGIVELPSPAYSTHCQSQTRLMVNTVDCNYFSPNKLVKMPGKFDGKIMCLKNFCENSLLL